MVRRCSVAGCRLRLSRLQQLCVALCLGSLLVCGLSAPGGGGRRSSRPQLLTLHHEQTIATLHIDANGTLARCQMLEVNYPEEERAALRRIARERPVSQVSFPRLLRTLLLCQRLDDARPPVTSPSPAAVTSQPTVTSHRRGRNADWSALTLFRGLVPGTKWCGLGDRAAGWNDLGTDAAIDLCCRTHDLCPVKVKAYKRRYGLFNWSIYTKSHCACDEAFLNCLKRSSSPTAASIGQLYFDLLQPQCLQARSCLPPESPIQCSLRQPADSRPIYKFSSMSRRFSETEELTSAAWRPTKRKKAATGVGSSDVSGWESLVRNVELFPEVSGGSRDHAVHKYDANVKDTYHGESFSEALLGPEPKISGGSRDHSATYQPTFSSERYRETAVQKIRKSDQNPIRQNQTQLTNDNSSTVNSSYLDGFYAILRTFGK